MVRRSVLVIMLILFCSGFCSCGGNNATPISEVDLEYLNTPEAQPVDTLPNFQDLPPVERELSLVGPGWFEVPLGNEYYQLMMHGGTVLPGGIEIDAAGATAWAIYGVGGFDGDNGPTSARVTTGDVTGEYWVGFSDYEHDQWLYAGPFTGSAEATIPGTSDYPSPNSFVSPMRTCYVAVMVPNGSFVRISQLELGIHGGVLGPQPPNDLQGGGGEDALELVWDPSLSAGDPDFAGYRLERAPQFYGDYVPVSAEPIVETFYLDEDLVLNELYRYRVAAVDVSGNLSMYAIAQWLGTVPGSQSAPVAILDLPAGPLYGPAEVTLDLSRSYDPAGGTIDTYEAMTSGLAPLSGPANSFTVNLQPGCYIFLARVHVGPRYGSTVRTFKVYPQWKEHPSTAFISGGTMPRLAQARAGVLPDGSPVFIGFDASIPSLAVWHKAGDDFQLTPLPVSYTGPPDFIGEPVLIGDSLNFVILGNDRIVTYSYDGNDGYISGGIISSGTIVQPVALVKLPGDQLGVVYAEDNGATTDIAYQKLGDTSTTQIVQDNITVPLTGLDAVYNAESDAIDIIFGDAIETHWRRFQPGVGNLKAVGMMIFDPLWLDLEVDPTTGRAVMAHFYDTVPKRVRYQVLLEDNELWTTMEPIDDSDDSLWPGDLIGTDNGMYYFGGLDNGGNPLFKLYEYDGSTWSPRNTSLSQYQDQINMALAWDSATADGWTVGQLASGDAQAEALLADGTSSIEWTLETVRGQGREMHGAVGADGLHVVYKDVETGLTYHLSSLTGAPWVYEGNPFGSSTDLDLGSTNTGEVYASMIALGNSAELRYWDGNAWFVQQAYPAAQGFRPSLSDQPLQDIIHWAVYIPVTTNLRYIDGSQIVPFGFTAVAPSLTPIWDGTVNNAGFTFPGSANLFAMAGGNMQPSGDIGMFTFPNESFELKLDFASVLQFPETWGRTMDSCVYYSYTDSTQAFWVAYGSVFNSVIYERHDQSESYTEIPLSGVEFSLVEDYRRTVSMGYAWGGSAVGLDCDLFGMSRVFKWSNLGNWEDLPLPAGLSWDEGGYLSMPELLIGDDGRWHIIYHDYSTDFIMVRSTL